LILDLSNSKCFSLASERLLFSFSLASFLGFCGLGFMQPTPLLAITVHQALVVFSLWAILSHPVYVFIKVSLTSQPLLVKGATLMSLVILGPVASWLVTLFLSPRFNLATRDKTGKSGSLGSSTPATQRMQQRITTLFKFSDASSPPSDRKSA